MAIVMSNFAINLRNIYLALVLILICSWIWYFDVNIFWFCPQKYLLRLESTLSKASYEYELPEISFQTNKSYKHFTFQFTPKVRVIFADQIFTICFTVDSFIYASTLSYLYFICFASNRKNIESQAPNFYLNFI